jgi:hypothetical protein
MKKHSDPVSGEDDRHDLRQTVLAMLGLAIAAKGAGELGRLAVPQEWIEMPVSVLRELEDAVRGQSGCPPPAELV